MSSSALCGFQVAGSDVSGWDRTMLNAFPAPIVYVMTCLESPILVFWLEPLS